jgi:hypothetical protein
MQIEQFLFRGFDSKEGPPPDVDFTGRWTNDLGSEMEITSYPDGTVTGKYKTNVGAPIPTEEFDLTGFTSGDLISFTVNFGKYASLTAWAGQHSTKSGTEVIYTLWLLAKNVADAEEPTHLWGALMAGANEFRRN